MVRLSELTNRKPSRWGNLTIREFERDIQYLQDKVRYDIPKYEELLDKIASMRGKLLNESDCVAEGHGMEDAIADPKAVLQYLENKIVRLERRN
ncbi:hypothetical protein ANABIO32_02220 [Rossellomorea marisflavi]|uniref:hypothetical protein n=1 Tax=Rossellomorea marisflavi TaxID=189381 RepID=UPI0025CA144D|nr:hypothetical protein [Rossellomorea marisflavi]GLI82535.1 hypothetical protein ANABIO32_02220 [Rossellomorea marisflavi]